jgi:hypothetical protein
VQSLDVVFGGDAEGQRSTPALFVGTTVLEVIVKPQVSGSRVIRLNAAIVNDNFTRILGLLLTKIVRAAQPLRLFCTHCLLTFWVFLPAFRRHPAMREHSIA